MARVKKSSRNAILIAAFVGVMAASGSLLGAICGVVLALLTRAVLSLNADTTYLMSVSVVIGGVAALLLGLAMVTPRAARMMPVARVEVTAQADTI